MHLNLHKNFSTPHGGGGPVRTVAEANSGAFPAVTCSDFEAGRDARL